MIPGRLQIRNGDFDFVLSILLFLCLLVYFEKVKVVYHVSLISEVKITLTIKYTYPIRLEDMRRTSITTTFICDSNSSSCPLDEPCSPFEPFALPTGFLWHWLRPSRDWQRQVQECPYPW